MGMAPNAVGLFQTTQVHIRLRIVDIWAYLDHTLRLRFRHCQCINHAVLYAEHGSGLPAVGVRQLGDWAVSVPDL